MLEQLFRLIVLIGGLLIIFRTLISAIRVLVLPRSAPDTIASFVFLTWRRLFDMRAKRTMSYEERDGIMAVYAPVSLLSLPFIWLILIHISYTGIFWALGVRPLHDAFALSGSSLLTLGFDRGNSYRLLITIFSEAAIGLFLIALLISYLPTIYSAFSRRETAVTLLEVRAGSPPSAAEMLTRAYRIQGLDSLIGLWQTWEIWFSDIEETHTSLAALVFFRSPRAHRSWITAAGTVLDTASIYASTLDLPRTPQAELCIRAGYIALRAIADFFGIVYDPNPAPTDPISVSREEFDAVYDELAEVGVPLKADRDQCWRDFAGWRVNYDTVLLRLAALTMAPYAPWISDRSILARPRIILPALRRNHRREAEQHEV